MHGLHWSPEASLLDTRSLKNLIQGQPKPENTFKIGKTERFGPKQPRPTGSSISLWDLEPRFNLLHLTINWDYLSCTRLNGQRHYSLKEHSFYKFIVPAFAGIPARRQVQQIQSFWVIRTITFPNNYFSSNLWLQPNFNHAPQPLCFFSPCGNFH